MKLNKRTMVLMFSMAFVISGCATIVGDKTQLVSVTSTPASAKIEISDEKGTNVFSGQTPTNVVLQKSDGSYWGGKDYTVTISKAGYKTQTIPVKSSPNGWYIAGNFIFGGLIGWFIVDPLNGAMYNLTPEQINASLGKTAAHNNTASDGNIAIMLKEDVPAALVGKMKRIN